MGQEELKEAIRRIKANPPSEPNKKAVEEVKIKLPPRPPSEETPGEKK